ncbi:MULTISPECIES: NF038104 family lipoprotein [Psychrobacter]|uniref:NF038104 family lipoprotein n=1 Tax=Psychrobacter aestuarii TaxID=556327 RepID=A0ABP3FDI9_9GAMM|nr:MULTISPECIES: NF038104 family lipoprotein [Psychrobacter]
MKKVSVVMLLVSTLFLQACVHKVVTVPVKIAYKTGKGLVKGTVAVAKAVTPGGDDKDDDKD